MHFCIRIWSFPGQSLINTVKLDIIKIFCTCKSIIKESRVLILDWQTIAVRKRVMFLKSNIVIENLNSYYKIKGSIYYSTCLINKYMLYHN